MNPDRLRELRRQRAAVADQLAWLDGEIAAETGSLPGRVVPSAAASSPGPEMASQATLDAYEADPSAVHRDTKRGCLLYFAAALLAFALALAAIYFLRYRDRPLLFSSGKAPAATAPDHRQSP